MFDTMDKTSNLESTFKRYKFQWIATIVANLICLGQGCAIGWLSPSLPMLFSTDRTPLPLDGAITAEQAGWIGSMVSIGGISGTFCMGLLTQAIGTKRSLLLCAGPLMLSWTLVYIAQHVWHLYIARVCVGFTCGGVFICLALFVAEIATETIRGRLSALMQVCFNSGILLGMVAGTWIEYHMIPLVMVFLPMAFLLLFVLVPQTPQWLLRSNRIAEAEQSLRFYRNCRLANRLDNKEQEELFRQEFDRMQTVAAQSSTAVVTLSDFLTPDAVRGLIVGPTLMGVSQFSGTFTLSNYASTIFTATGSSIDPNVCAISVGCLQIIGTCCASLLIDRWGRKLLLLLSTLGCTIALAVTAAFVYAAKHELVRSEDWNALPVLALSLFIFIAAIGIIPVPYVMVAEILPQKIRKIGATICTTSVSMFSFVILKGFPVMLHRLELHGCLTVFAAVSLFGVLFTLFVVRETSGRRLDVVQTDEEQNTKM